jgi:lysophosphatidate acyltransferase
MTGIKTDASNVPYRQLLTNQSQFSTRNYIIHMILFSKGIFVENMEIGGLVPDSGFHLRISCKILYSIIRKMTMLVDYLSFLALCIIRIYLAYFSLCFITSFVGVYQEYKIWVPNSVPSLSLWGMVKVYLFNVVWTTGSLIGATLLFLKYLLFGNIEKDAAAIERSIALLVCTLFVGPIEIRNAEKLPPINPGSPAPIYIANHGSQIDLGAVYSINRRFKWIAKAQVRLLPGVGQLMTLSQHVFIDRATGKNQSSVQNLYQKSNDAVQSGIPMFFFPQGTRRMAERRPFKDGAFHVALQNQSPLVPLSLDIPLDAWNRLYPLGGVASPIVITVHDTISVTGKEDKEVLKKRCFEIIHRDLPDYREKHDKKER